MIFMQEAIFKILMVEDDDFFAEMCYDYFSSNPDRSLNDTSVAQKKDTLDPDKDDKKRKSDVVKQKKNTATGAKKQKKKREEEEKKEEED